MLYGSPDFTVGTWLGSSTGALTEVGSTALGFDSTLGESVVGDWNRDGHLDAAYAELFRGSIALYRGDGAGGLAHEDPFFETVHRDLWFDVGDLDNDDRGDLVTLSWFDGRLSVYRNVGGDVFETISSQACDGCSRAYFAELNSDGNLDLLITRALSSPGYTTGVETYLGDGTGAFTAVDLVELEISTLSEPQFVDFNGDSILDILIRGDSVYPLVGVGNGEFSPLPPIGTPGYALTAADLDSDGDIDFATTGLSEIEVYAGAGGFALSATLSLPFPSNLDHGDFDGDGRVDLLLWNRRTHEVIIAYGDVGGGFVPGSPISAADLVPLPRWYQETRDMNGDGRTDVLLKADSAVHVLGVGPSGDFSLLTTLHSSRSNQAQISDLDGDGLRDLATLTELGSSSRVRVQYGIPCFPVFLRGDVNADQAFDITDAVATLELLVGLGAVDCETAADSNDDGLIDIADPVYALNHLFVGGPPPGAPFVECGPDPTPSGLGCAVSPCP